ncbi:hypothetical protein GYMLUDRAFT_239132 [Collybiopsis luxurians FD-317 M1]|nr:hypothetical protein GYMLUDRAFT_239132 [Collybiopsis luxurians FD-317 M1]
MFTSFRFFRTAAAALGVTVLSTPLVSSILPQGVNIDTPTFSPIYDGIILFAPDVTQNVIPGPSGERAFISISGGNVTNATTGALAAQIIPSGGEFGLLSTVNGKFYPDVSLVLQWTDDSKFAFLKLNGIGQVVLAISSAHPLTSPLYLAI